MFGFSKRGHRCGEEHPEGQRRCGERMHRGGRHSMATEGADAPRGGRRGRGDKMHRLFEHGDLRVVLLALLDKKPSHGYELIKAIEEASSGLYVPSPGVIYPTLTLLEEQDFVTPVATGNGRKSYQITAAGKAELQQNQEMVDIIFSRLAQVNRRPEGNLAEGISDAMHRLRHILRSNMVRSDVTPEQVVRINAALLTAVEAIEKELTPPSATPDTLEQGKK
ncbi:PadR family transcriptional regulator [Yersinia frederiksenii]|uniref:PadR family transcriptional regulator n=1 Tax=Yersinia frederiksenii TaxID=29484 RepID=UPI0005E6C31C|nr:PadR family transcriptional regulator [Yersinia frederiksenii]CNF86785.1 PadR family transcriptional regulator [Yersinia frederiksenii]